MLMASVRLGPPLDEEHPALKRLYQEAVEKMAGQAAHVTVARLLLYRVAEDQGVYPPRISGDRLDPLRATESWDRDGQGYPATNMVLDLRATWRKRFRPCTAWASSTFGS